MTTRNARRLTVAEVEALDPYLLMAVLGKHVIHPGGRLSTEELFRLADFAPDQRVLGVGCGVGATAVEVARRYGASVTALDVSPTMLESASVAAAGVKPVREADLVGRAKGTES